MESGRKHALMHVIGAFVFLAVAVALVCGLVLGGVIKGNVERWGQETLQTTTSTIVIYP